MKTWFITGGTPGGFGMAYAEAALEQGDRVVLTARRPDELAGWADGHGERVLVLPLDVTDEQQVRTAVSTAEDRFGGIDVLVNNAGRGWYGSVEGMDDAAVRKLFELNFFSVVAVTRAVLPGMRARRDGWIVNMSSVAGLRGVVGFGFYTAAKFAIEGLTDVLRQEVAPLGIKVLAVEPGRSAPAPTRGSPTSRSRRASPTTCRCSTRSARPWSSRTASSRGTPSAESARSSRRSTGRTRRGGSCSAARATPRSSRSCTPRSPRSRPTKPSPSRRISPSRRGFGNPPPLAAPRDGDGRARDAVDLLAEHPVEVLPA